MNCNPWQIIQSLPSKPQFQLKLSLHPSFPPSPLASLCYKTNNQRKYQVLINNEKFKDKIWRSYLEVVWNKITQAESIMCNNKVNTVIWSTLVHLKDKCTHLPNIVYRGRGEDWPLIKSVWEVLTAKSNCIFMVDM